jgi:hypothetical protein
MSLAPTLTQFVLLAAKARAGKGELPAMPGISIRATR